MSEADIDAQRDEMFRKAADSHDVTHTQTVDNRNQLSTPVLLGFLIVVAVMCIGLTVVGIQSGYASAAAQQAERNAKLAQYQLEEAIKKLEELK